MARFIAALIRHGDYQQLAETPSALQPFPLTEIGRQQAKQAALDISLQCVAQNWQINPIIASSKLLRAWQTADILAKDLLANKSIIQEYIELAERQVGSVANLSVTQIEQIISADPRYDSLPKNWKSNSHFCLPFQGAESLLEAGQRVAACLEQQMQALIPQKQDQLQIFVGHGAAFRHAAYHLGVLHFEQIAQLSMYHCQPVYIERQSNGRWQHIVGDWKVREKNSHYTD